MNDDVQNNKDEIVKALLCVMKDHNWADITLIDVANAANLPLQDVCLYFEVKEDILSSYGRQLDRQIADNIGQIREDETCRDRLFDILMERYELLNENRAAVISLFNAIKYDPSQVLTALPHLNASIKHMVELSGMESKGARGALRIAGVAAIYLHGIYNFVHDNGDEMAKVMAGLDRDLARAEDISNLMAI